MAAEFEGPLHVLDLSERGALCATSTDGEAFWLPRHGHVRWGREPEVGQAIDADVPRWLTVKHQQLSGEVELERVKEGLRQSRRPDERRSIAKEIAMTATNREADAGSGALFKNDSKEKASHPDYRGDVTILGRKFWVSGRIKEGKKGKYLSLAFRPVDDEDKPSAAAKASVSDPF